MPKLFSSALVEKVLHRKGFVLVSQKGSHKKFRKTGGSLVKTVIVPANRREIPVGTFRSILRQSGLTSKDF